MGAGHRGLWLRWVVECLAGPRGGQVREPCPPCAGSIRLALGAPGSLGCWLSRAGGGALGALSPLRPPAGGHRRREL